MNRFSLILLMILLTQGCKNGNPVSESSSSDIEPFTIQRVSEYDFRIVNMVYMDPDGVPFIGTLESLDRFFNEINNFAVVGNQIIQDPKRVKIFADKYYVSTGSGLIASSSNGKVWKEEINIGEEVSDFTVLASGTMIFGAEEGVYIKKSADQTARFIRLFEESFLFRPVGNQMIESANGSIMATAFNGLYQSSDDGETWSKISGEFSADENNLTFLKKLADGTILLGAKSKLYSSSDNGASWSVHQINGVTPYEFFRRGNIDYMHGDGSLYTSLKGEFNFEKVFVTLEYQERTGEFIGALYPLYFDADRLIFSAGDGVFTAKKNNNSYFWDNYQN